MWLFLFSGWWLVRVMSVVDLVSKDQTALRPQLEEKKKKRRDIELN